MNTQIAPPPHPFKDYAYSGEICLHAHRNPMYYKKCMPRMSAICHAMTAATAFATTCAPVLCMHGLNDALERCHDPFDTSPRFPQRLFSFGADSTAWQHPKALGPSSRRSLLGGHKTAVQGCHEIGGRVRLGAGATHSDSAAANTARPRGRGIGAGGCGHQLPAHIL